MAGKHAFYFEERTLERGKRIKAAAARHVGKFWTLRRRQGIDDGARLRDAELIHEAAIGKIAGEQLIKLMTLGLTEKEAEEQIINGFLK